MHRDGIDATAIATALGRSRMQVYRVLNERLQVESE